MNPPNDLKVQYITDDSGLKTGVIMSVQDFEELVEDLHDLAIIAERRDEPTLSHDEVIAELKRDGLLPS